MVQIFVFGDSLAYGMWDSQGGWVARLRKTLDGKSLKNRLNQVWEIFNLSISGTTSGEVVKCLPFEYKHRAWAQAQTAIILAVGINDAIWENGTPWYPPEEFKKNVTALCRTARELTERVVYVGLTPVDQTKVDPIPWDTSRAYKNETIQSFNQIIKEVCQTRNIPFVDLWSVFQTAGYKTLLRDGAHANNQGHDLIYRTVLPVLTRTGIIDNND
jgi:lysophospholipase L1-like esterase